MSDHVNKLKAASMTLLDRQPGSCCWPLVTLSCYSLALHSDDRRSCNRGNERKQKEKQTEPLLKEKGELGGEMRQGEGNARAHV